MHDLILEIDRMLWFAVIAFAVLAVVLSLLTEDTRRPEPDVILYEKEPAKPDLRPKEYKPMETPSRTTGAPVDNAISEYRSAKLRSCEREIEMLEQLKFVESEQTREQTIQDQPEIKQDYDDKKRGLWD